MKIYLVGGAVRDRLRGTAPQDKDYVVVGGSEEALRKRVPGLVRVGQGIPVFVRAGAQYVFSECACIEEDLAARDLTINALAEDEDGTLCAHPLALSDLEQGVLRPVAVENFLVDPLRVLRAARFAAVFPEFTVHASLLEAMRSVPSVALGAVAAERVGQEMLKACAASRPGNVLRVLHAGRGLRPWLREFAEAGTIPAGPPEFHATDVLEHTARVMDACAGDALAAWMGLCHDLGKTATPPELLPRHHGHETRGTAMAEELGLRLRLPRRHVRAGAVAAAWRMAAGQYRTLRASTRVRLLLTLDKADVLASFFRVVRADGGGDGLERAEDDLRIVKSVHLPERHRNQGPRSAEILLQLRCEALGGGGEDKAKA